MKVTWKENQTLPEVQYLRTIKKVPLAKEINEHVGPPPDYNEIRLNTKGLTVTKEYSKEISRVSYACLILMGYSHEYILRTRLGAHYPYDIKFE